MLTYERPAVLNINSLPAQYVVTSMEKAHRELPRAALYLPCEDGRAYLLTTVSQTAQNGFLRVTYSDYAGESRTRMIAAHTRILAYL